MISVGKHYYIGNHGKLVNVMRIILISDNKIIAEDKLGIKFLVDENAIIAEAPAESNDVTTAVFVIGLILFVVIIFLMFGTSQ